jgi:hypothetical protein
MCADKRQRLQIECTTNGMTFTLAMYSLCALRPALVTRAFFHLLCRFVPYAMGKLALQFDHLCVCVCVCVCVCACACACACVRVLFGARGVAFQFVVHRAQ